MKNASKLGAAFLTFAALANLPRATDEAVAAPTFPSEAHMTPTEDVRAATDGIEQALFRFAAGQDLKDPDLLGTAFSADATLDFRQPATELGAQAEVMRGRKEIVDTITSVTAPMITSHTISNVRIVQISELRAEAHALIEAMHVDREHPNRRLLLKNSLKITAIQIGQQWQISSLHFRNLWREGNPKLLFPGATGSMAGWSDYEGPVSVILYEPGPKWQKGRPLVDQGLESHGRYLIKLTRQGRVLSAGPLASGGGLVIVAGSSSDAETVMSSDPAVQDRKFIGTISQWSPMMGWLGRLPLARIAGE